MIKVLFTTITILLLILLCAPIQGATRIDVLGLFNGMAVLKVHGERRVLKTGQTSPEGIRLVESTSAYAVVEIDGIRKKLTLSNNAAGIGTEFKSAEKSSVRILPDKHGMYMVPGRINHSTVRFMVDTGASLVAMSSALARRLGIDYRMAGIPARASTAAGVVEAFRVRLNNVQVGDIRISNVEAMVVMGDHPDQPLLGMSFLEKVQIEREGKIMLLQSKY